MAVSRREFLHTAAGTTAALALPSALAAQPPEGMNGILLLLVGGPSQLDTWDPKPDAPSDVRGPYSAIRTRVPGTYVSELFPRMAAHADRFSLVRSMHHDAAPIHETGLQLLQTGELHTTDTPAPCWGARLARQQHARHALLPGPIGFTGVSVDHGQSAGSLGMPYEAQQPTLHVHDDPARERFGRTPFGDDCLRAARLVEQGTRWVTVNMFTEVYDALSWDCHAAGGSLKTTLGDYRTIAPIFDQAYTALLEHLRERGLLQNTFVLATGEMGRTPHMNRDGGRDHWAGVWTMLLAGGGIPGGQILGTSDAHAAEPKDNPWNPTTLANVVRDRLRLS